MVLEKLHEVDWDQLEHAYGAAGSVPSDITRLLSEDKEVREGAIGGLHVTILHQGSICGATEYAIPFLVALLNAPAVKGKGLILGLLAGIYETAQRFLQHLPSCRDHILAFCLEYRHLTIDEAENEYRTERSWHEHSAAAIEAAMQTYRALGTNKEGEVRLGVTYMMKSLAASPHFQDEAATYLLTCLDDDDDQVRGMAIFSLAEVAPMTPSLAGRLEQQVDDASRPLPQYTAAYVLVGRLQGGAPAAAIRILFDAMDIIDTLSLLQDDLSYVWSFGFDDWLNMIGLVETVSHLGPAVAKTYHPTLLRYAGFKWASPDLMVPLLRLILDRDRVENVDPGSLSRGQRAILQAIGDNLRLWIYEDGHSNGNMARAMESLGLPTKREAYLAWLAAS